MKILHLRASNFYGGPERQLHFHSLNTRGSEFDITIGSFSENGRTPQFLDVIAADGLATHTFPVKSAYDPAAISSLRKYLRDNMINILCTHDYRTHLIGFLAARGSNARWIVFSRGWTAENPKIKMFNLLDKIIVRFARHIVAVSDSQAKRLNRIFIPRNKISVVHNAIDPDKFKDHPPVDLKARFGFPADSVICISGGRFSPEKGQIFLAEAAVRAIGENRSLRFIIFGDGPQLEIIKNAVARLGQLSHIYCPGFESDLIGCLKGADMLVNPSLSEGLPNIVLEAMALMIPVVATGVGGVPELITDGQNGLLISPADIESLADAILRMAGQPDLRHKIRLAAHQTINERFSFEIQTDKLKKIYLKTAG